MVDLVQAKGAIRRRKKAADVLSKFRTSFAIAEVLVGGKTFFVVPAVQWSFFVPNDSGCDPYEMWIFETAEVKEPLKKVDILDIEEVVRIVKPASKIQIEEEYGHPLPAKYRVKRVNAKGEVVDPV